jgi:hypothetical protein
MLREDDDGVDLLNVCSTVAMHQPAVAIRNVSKEWFVQEQEQHDSPVYFDTTAMAESTLY